MQSQPRKADWYRRGICRASCVPCHCRIRRRSASPARWRRSTQSKTFFSIVYDRSRDWLPGRAKGRELRKPLTRPPLQQPEGNQLVEAAFLRPGSLSQRPELRNRLAAFRHHDGGAFPYFTQIGAEPRLEFPRSHFFGASLGHVVIVTTLPDLCQVTWRLGPVIPLRAPAV